MVSTLNTEIWVLIQFSDTLMNSIKQSIRIAVWKAPWSFLKWVGKDVLYGGLLKELFWKGIILNLAKLGKSIGSGIWWAFGGVSNTVSKIDIQKIEDKARYEITELSKENEVDQCAHLFGHVTHIFCIEESDALSDTASSADDTSSAAPEAAPAAPAAPRSPRKKKSAAADPSIELIPVKLGSVLSPRPSPRVSKPPAAAVAASSERMLALDINDEIAPSYLSDLYLVGQIVNIDTSIFSGSFIRCLSQGILHDPVTTCAQMTTAVVNFANEYNTIGSKLQNLSKITFNQIMNHHGPKGVTRNMDLSKIYFLNGKKPPSSPEVVTYNKMYRIKDPTPDEKDKVITNYIEKYLSENVNYLQCDDKEGTIIYNDTVIQGGPEDKKERFYIKTNSTPPTYHAVYTFSYDEIIKSEKNPEVFIEPIPIRQLYKTYEKLIYKVEKEHKIKDIVGVKEDGPCLEELEETRFINFKFDYSDFILATKLGSDDSIKPTVKQSKIDLFTKYQNGEEIKDEKK
jgi:hypothetical protein